MRFLFQGKIITFATNYDVEKTQFIIVSNKNNVGRFILHVTFVLIHWYLQRRIVFKCVLRNGQEISNLTLSDFTFNIDFFSSVIHIWFGNWFIQLINFVFNFLGVSHMVWNGHNYFLSWREPWHKFEDWDWFNGRNFCRDRCMDLVSFDTPGEYQLFAGIMRQGECQLPFQRY